MAAYAAVLLAATGCASIVNDADQPMKLETKTAAGETITGAECRLQNNEGTISARSGETARVRRSSEDLEISCTHPGNPEAIGRAISRANAGMAGNILFGGLIGATIDHSKGTAYTYPTWIQLVFGKTLVFDRSAEKEGFPVVGAEPNSSTEAQAPSAPKSPAAAKPTPASQPAPAAQPVSTTAQPVQPVTSGQPVLTRQPLMLNSEPKPAPSAQPQTHTTQPQDVQQRLEKLQSLRNNGLITQEEYQAKKKEILDAF
ncbi:MAG: SHOCT domain-containing protein [Rhodocyclaceae bacterium]|nr:SHOCT domain-containing protein [Rhodocyclaceae bacterium]